MQRKKAIVKSPLKRKIKKWVNPSPENMPPGQIDLQRIDPSLRSLVAALNKTQWCRTVGSCSGAADHGEGRSFYMILDVGRSKFGTLCLANWLSLSHAEGYRATYETKTLPDCALVRATIDPANFLHYEVNSPHTQRYQLHLFQAVWL